MKKTIITLIALSSTAFGVAVGPNVTITTKSNVEGAMTVEDGKAGLEFTYTAGGTQNLTTLDDNIKLWAMSASPLDTENVTLTLNIQGRLQLINTGFALGTGSGFKMNLTTTITNSELAALSEADAIVSRWVFDFTNGEKNISNFSTNKVSLTLNGLNGYTNGGIVFDCNGTYYAGSDVTFSGDYATVKDNASALSLADGSFYTTYKITGNKGASIKGIGFVATAPIPETPAIPEPATATLSLLALAGLAARRRRK